MVYTLWRLDTAIARTDIAKLFRNGRCRAARLPREVGFEGDRVRISGVGQSVLREPIIEDPAESFRRLDETNSGPFR